MQDDWKTKILLCDLKFGHNCRLFMAPNNGLNGSRGWKSIGPFLICTITLSRNLPSKVQIQDRLVWHGRCR